jgi:hypothetical protein
VPGIPWIHNRLNYDFVLPSWFCLEQHFSTEL